VRHTRFGEGVVQSVKGGIKPSVVATFPGFGATFIQLENKDPDYLPLYLMAGHRARLPERRHEDAGRARISAFRTLIDAFTA
jgi:hypothetical protein